jgi:hypothetical protein
MKYILFFVISLIANIVCTQTTVHGYCVLNISEDSTVEMNRYFSTETYNDTGENVYEKIFPLGNPDSIYNIDYNIGTSNDYIRESVKGTDTARYYYIYDTINSRSYIIAGSDTSMIYSSKYENGLLVENNCLLGCEHKEVIHYNSVGKEDTVLTIWKDGDSSYTIRVYDDLNRQILFKSFLKSPEDIPSEQFRTIYDDSLLNQTDFFESPGREDDGSREITHFDQNKSQ